MKSDILKNFIEFITNLCANGYYGKVEMKIENGTIVMVEKYDKIKLDNTSYLEYKRKNT